MSMTWHGVMPAITTPFKPDLSVDHEFLARHCRWLVENGCTGIVTPGSLGEGATLTTEEKCAIWRTCLQAVGDRVSVVAAISALSTGEAVALAKAAKEEGCSGLMVLPPYVYRGDWREMRAHIGAVFQATDLSCMLYNNPVAYGTDFLPDQIEELCKGYANLDAVKESSMDVRRLTAIHNLVGDQLALFCGVDDLIVEGIRAGAIGWVAGLANALPRESVELFRMALKGDEAGVRALYRWFLPLLHMDTVPKFVQLIKLVQQEVDMGSARVRMPRMELAGGELASTRSVIHAALEERDRWREKMVPAKAR